MKINYPWRYRLIAVTTITRNEIFRFLRLWPETLVPSIITSTLYFIIFGQLLGSKLPSVDGINYTQYIAPGLIMMSVINNAYTNVVTSFFLMRFQRSIEEILIAPVSNAMLLISFALGGILRGLLVGSIVTVVTLLFTKLTIHHILITLLIIFLTSALFALAGLTNAIYAKNFDDITIVSTFILTPLTFLGGVFYSIHQLPSVWQNFSKLNPILYLINAFRYGVLGFTDVSISLTFTFITAAVVFLFIFNLYILNKGVGIRT